MNFRRTFPIFFLFFLGLLSGCDFMSNDKVAAPPNQINIAVGEPGQQFEQTYPGSVVVNRQPAGLNFYKVVWNSSAKGKVQINAGKHGFVVPNVMSVVGTEDEEYKREGMSELSIVCGLSGQNGISHEAARDSIHELFEVLRRSGWRATVAFDDPRLSGKDMLTYYFKSIDNPTLDPAHKPSLADWMRIKDLANWEFYADGIFLRVNFIRDKSHMDLEKPGYYILNIVLKSDAEYFKGLVGPDNREQWIERLPSELKDLAERRRRKEDELSKLGMSINKNYVDPPLPAAVLK